MWSGSVSFKYRVEDPRLGRFFSVDPLVFKYPHNSVFAFQQNMVGLGKENEGCELNPMVHLWKEVPVITQSDVNEVVEKIQPVAKVVQNVAIIAGGVITIALTAGTAAPAVASAFAILSGSMAIAGGTAKLTLDLAGKSELSEKVPTSFVEATISVTLKYVYKGTAYEQEVKVASDAIKVAEGILTLDLKKVGNLSELSQLDVADQVITGANIIVDAKETKSDLKTLDQQNKESKTNEKAKDDKKPKDLLKVEIEGGEQDHTQVKIDVPKMAIIPPKN